MSEQNSASPKLRWYPDIACPVCGQQVNSWDKRCSYALGYQQIVCESCIAWEYEMEIEELRDTMKTHFGMFPCPGL